MAIVRTTIPEVNELMDSADERELWTVVREHEREPFFFPNEGVGNRLNRAARVVTEGRITPNSDGSYTVEGSDKRTYRVTNSCSCPQSQKGKSKYCYHFVAVCVYVEWQRRLRPVAPVNLGTLRAGTASLPTVPDDDELGNGYPVDDETLPLPLPPTSVDERLAAATTACVTNALQEDRMPADAYIPEPDDAPPIAVMDAPEATPPAPVKIPREFTVNIKGKTHVLYTGLVIAARHDGLVSLSADWTYNDAELSLAHAVCTFADGRRYEESGDASPSNVSKGISPHFRRVALTRAKARCLRDALGIAECSVEEMEDDGGKRETPDMTQGAPEDLKKQIWAQIKQQAPNLQREEVGKWVWEHTGLALTPANYPQIMGKLTAVGR